MMSSKRSETNGVDEEEALVVPREMPPNVLA